MEEVRVLLVSRDDDTRSATHNRIRENGWTADEATDGIAALKLFRRNEYQFILMSLELPELDGRNVLIQMRKVSDVPIFVFCSHQSETDCLDVYNIGADDCIVTPFSDTVLIAKMRVFLRRSGTRLALTEPKVSYKGLHIDTYSHTVFVDETPISLTPKQYALLSFLSQNPNRAFSRAVLLDEVWGPDFDGSDRTVDTHIKSLRICIQPYESCIATVWGYGYKFEV